MTYQKPLKCTAQKAECVNHRYNRQYNPECFDFDTVEAVPKQFLPNFESHTVVKQLARNEAL